MNSSYQIYLEKRTVDNTKIYRIFVQHQRSICSINGHVTKDIHQNIYQGKVIQTFLNGRARIQLDNYTYAYTERSFKGKHLNVGESAWVQTGSISPLEMDYKDQKGTLNVSLTCGPIILYPFDPGIHISQRLKHYPEFANSIKKHFEPFSGRFGIKFRLSTKDYSFRLLEQIISFLKTIWDHCRYNKPEFLILNPLLSYFLFPTEIFTNDPEISAFLSESIGSMFQTQPNVRQLPDDIDFLEDAWDQACQKQIPLSKGGSILIQETPACVVVDINAGSETSYDTVNRETINLLPKILHQGRFGGKIVVDLLPMSNRNESDKLLRQFDAKWHELDMTPQLFGISKMGLLEFILPRRGYPLWWIDNKFIKTKIVLDK